MYHNLFKLLCFSFIMLGIGTTQAQTNVSGTIGSNTTWTLANSPYLITGNVGVPDGVTLTIEPGVQVEYQGDYELLVVGSIRAQGNQAAYITFKGNGISDPWDKKMLMFKKTDLSQSLLSYVNFTGKQYAIQVGEEAEHNQALIKNSGTLNISYATFTNTAMITDGYSTTAKVVMQNITLNGSLVKGNYPRSEPIEIKDSQVMNGSTIFSDSYNKGISLDKCIVENSLFNVGCCGANLTINNSTLYKSPFRQTNSHANVTVNNSKLIESPLHIHNGDATLNKCVVVYDANKNFDNARPQFGVLGKQIVMNKCSIIAKNGGTGIDISSNNGNDNNQLSQNTFVGNQHAITVAATNGSFNVQNNNFINSLDYSIQNASGRDIAATSNYWGTTNSSNIDQKIFDSKDDLNKGTVSYTPYLTALNVDAPVAPPVQVQITEVSNGVKITWATNQESDLAGYKIHYEYDGKYSFAKAIDVGNVTSYVLAGVTIQDIVAVTAYDNLADGTNDQVEGHQSWFNNFDAPEAPESFTARPLSSSKLLLNWSDNNNDETGFEIQRATSENGTYTTIHTTTANVQSYEDTSLALLTTYYYRIRTITSSSFSGFSYASATTLNLQPPAKPVNLKVQALSTSSVQLSWEDKADNEGGFKVERFDDNAGDFVVIASTQANDATFKDSLLTVGNVYLYRVRAFNAKGFSAYSNLAQSSSTITCGQKPVISQVDNGKELLDSLSCNTAGKKYHWFLDGQALNDSTQTIKALVSGVYTVQVVQDLCTSPLSAGFDFVAKITGISPNHLPMVKVSAYPNPSTNWFTIELPQTYPQVVRVVVLNNQGQPVYRASQEVNNQKLSLNLAHLNKGIYQLMIYTDKQVFSQRLMKH